MRTSLIFRYFFIYALLVLSQVLIFSNIRFGGYINPYVYIMFIMLLPIDIAGWGLLLSAFGMGLTIDMFLDSAGMHAAASVLLAFARPAVIKLISVRADFESGTIPSVSSQGLNWIMTYVFFLVLIHHMMLFFLEVFRFTEFWSTILRVLGSGLFTWAFIMLGFFIAGRTSRR